jgi:uncharacterized membrane protein
MSEMPPSSGSINPPPSGGSYTPPPPPPIPPPTGTPPGANSDRTIMLVLSYLGILGLIPLLTKKEDPEVQWHAKNGLALFVAELIIVVAFWIVGQVPYIGCMMSIVSCVLPLAFIALAIILIMKAVNGERFRIPVVTDFAEKM